MRFLIPVVISLISFCGCNTRIEGCLDVNAENFDFDAERSCDGCCTYPALNLTLTQKWGERNFANSDTLLDLSGQPYQIEDLRYFLSAWNWENSEGERFTVDSLEAPCGDTMLRYRTDNLTIDTRKFVYTLGTRRESPTMTSLNCSLGLLKDYSCFDSTVPGTPTDLTDQSPLWNPVSGKLEAVRLIIRTELDSPTLDTIFMDISSSVTMLYDLQLITGTDAQLFLTVDYGKWFEEVDINNLNSFQMSVLQHFSESLFPTP